MIDVQQEIEFLILIRDKVDLAANDIAIKGPLEDISRDLTGRIQILEQQRSA